MNSEPIIKIAIIQQSQEASLNLEDTYRLADGRMVIGSLTARTDSDAVTLEDASGQIIARGVELLITPADPAAAFFTLLNVRIGIQFHWERVQTQSFRGGIILRMDAGETFCILNLIGLEDYLASVISSEMSADAPLEFLQAQAVTARSWLVAMLEKKKALRTMQHRGES